MVNHIDGNVVAGPLADFFHGEMTGASGRCRSCGDISVIAQAIVYASEMGQVMRCNACGEVLAIIVQSPERSWVDLHGLSGLQLPS